MSCEFTLGLIFRADDDARLTPLDRAVLRFLLRPSDGIPTRAVMAERIGCAPNSIPRSAKKLTELGYIERTVAPGERTGYRISGRNLEVTCNNAATCNTQVTVTPELRAADRVVTEPQATSPSVVTSELRVVTSPPTPPIEDNSTSKVELNSDRPELGGEGGTGGDLFGAVKPSRRKRTIIATHENMPLQMSPRMVEFAAKHGYLNGSGIAMFDRWRTNRIANGAKIADLDASFQTWILNGPRYGMPPPSKGAARNGIRKNPYIRSANA